MLMTADCFVELARTAKSGTIHSVRFAFPGELTFTDIFRTAHQNADGSPPTLDQVAGDPVMLIHARRLRAAEGELSRRVQEDVSTDPESTITDVIACARCGGDHRSVEFRRLARAFAPPEAAPIVWGFWAPCPSNGDPILQSRTRPTAT